MIACLAWAALSLSADPVSWTVTTADRVATMTGDPVFTPGFGVTLDSTSIAAGDLIQLRRSPRPAWPGDASIVLANGDRLPGKILGGDARSITVANELLSKVQIPLTTVAFISTVRIAGATADPLTSDWLGDRKTDIVRLLNGDILRGSVTAFSADGSRIEFKETGRAVQSIAMANVAGIGFATGLSRVRTPTGRYGHVVLSDGTRLTISEAKSVRDSLDVTAAAGFSARIAPRDLIAVTVRGGRAVFLADLKPIVNESTSSLSERWPLRFHRSAKGNPLQLGDDHADFGVGMHGTSTLTFDLAKSYRRFDALTGFNAETGRLGRISFSVAIDDSPQSIELTAETEPLAITRDVTGRSRLTIAIAVGPAGDRGANLDLADAWLVK